MNEAKDSILMTGYFLYSQSRGEEELLHYKKPSFLKKHTHRELKNN